MIGAGELADLQDAAAFALPDRCRVLRPGAAVSDGAGGWTPGAATTVAEVACSIAPSASGAEAQTTSRVVAEADWTITTPAGTDVTTADQIVQTDAAGVALRTFEVIGTAAPRSYEITRRLGCRLARA